MYFLAVAGCSRVRFQLEWRGEGPRRTQGDKPELELVAATLPYIKSATFVRKPILRLLVGVERVRQFGLCCDSPRGFEFCFSWSVIVLSYRGRVTIQVPLSPLS